MGKQHLKASRNLLKVADNIVMFEKDAVNILTTVVIECTECDLHKSASKFATKLSKDYDQSLIPAAYIKRIEKIARKAYDKQEEPQETSSPCPFCKADIPDYSLECNNCHNIVPFCIASGRHVIAAELVKCPVCLFPAILSELVSYLGMSNEKICPMCEEPIDHQLLEVLEDHLGYLKSRKIANMEAVEKEAKAKENYLNTNAEMV